MIYWHNKHPNLAMSTIVFLAFYDKNNYELLLKHADDRKKLDDKWEDWVANFLKAKANFIAEFEVVEYPVDVEIMAKYFNENKLKNTGANRSKYVSEQGAGKYNLKSKY